MRLDVSRWIDSVWILVGVYWLLGALRTKPTARGEKPLSRIRHLSIMAVALTLLFSSAIPRGFLHARFVPPSVWIGWAGFCITLAGCAIAVWARTLLGSNWSSTVTLKQDHELIRTGPYAVVRHPIYSGFLLGMLGTALALGEVRGFIALGVAFAGWLIKSCAEEQFLVEQFDGAYVRYRGKVKQLIPFVF